MSDSESDDLTEFARYFVRPGNATHRQYEALRAYFVEALPSHEVARRFGYTPGSFRVLCHQFRAQPDRAFFLPPAKGPKSAPKTDPVRDQVIALRKQNLSIYDISRVLAEGGCTLSAATVAQMLKAEGFARLPRRRDDERPEHPHPEAAAPADVRALDLSPRSVRTRFGGLFLFLPWLARIPLDALLQQARFPGSRQVPAACAVRALLALKLFGAARHSHVMSEVFDDGLALFAGLNRPPKRSFLTEYSCRIDPRAHAAFMPKWFDAVGRLGLERGLSFHLDFHTIPFHGEDALVEKHYVSKRSRRQKGMLAFLAEDADARVFCYANSDLRKAEQNDEILRFVEFWQQRTGKLPARAGVRLQTHHPRQSRPAQPAWASSSSPCAGARPRCCAPSPRCPSRSGGASSCPTSPAPSAPRASSISASNSRAMQGKLRQLTITDLGHEEPTLLVTNQLHRSAAKLITRYAQRMVIENSIADGIEFFHIDALSSAVAMKVNCDLQLTLMASQPVSAARRPHRQRLPTRQVRPPVPRLRQRYGSGHDR